MHKYFTSLLLTVFLFTGCHHTHHPSKNKSAAVALYIQAEENIPTDWTIPATLPISGTAFRLFPKPIVTQTHIKNAELTNTEYGAGLLLHLNKQGSSLLHAATINNPGKQLVLVVNDGTLGFRPIQAPNTSGQIMFFLEIEQNELARLVSLINNTP